jgi:hypothetical protein
LATFSLVNVAIGSHHVQERSREDQRRGEFEMLEADFWRKFALVFESV